MRLITLNTWALPWNLSFDPEGRMSAIASAILETRPDVVALQELWNHSASRQLIEALARDGLAHRWTDGIGMGNGGLALVARHPIRRARFTRFRVQGRPERFRHGDYYGGKGYVEATLDLGEHPITVFNTHLHSRHVSSAPHQYTAERTAQAVQLAAALNGFPATAVITGDFNMSPRDEVYQVFRTLAGCTDAATQHGTAQETHFHRASGRRERLDYVFVRNGGSGGLAVENCSRALDEELVAGLPVRRYSDHAAVVVDLETDDAPVIRPPDAEATQAALSNAERITREARQAMTGRQGRQRFAAVAGLGLATGGAVASRKLRRRSFLKTATLAASGIAATGSVGLLSLSEYSSQQELLGFDHVLELLHSMRQRS